MSLSNRTALVTGGGTGIGEGIALALAKEDCRVAICGRREAPLEQVAEKHLSQVKNAKNEIIYKTCDVSDFKDVSKLVDWATGALGRIDILVNNAGINVANRMMSEVSLDDYQKMMNINAAGTFYGMKSVLPQMRERKEGLIINISSISGIRANPLGGPAYAASKFAQSALGFSVSEEERLEGRHIRVTNIYPGEVETPIMECRKVHPTKEHRARVLQKEDVAAAVVMVAKLPPRARVATLAILPTMQSFL